MCTSKLMSIFGGVALLITASTVSLAAPAESQTEVCRSAACQKIACRTPKTAQDSWANMQLCFHENANRIISEEEIERLAAFLNAWNKTRNARDAAALAALAGDSIIVRGERLSRSAYLDKMKKAFQKHTDYQQTPEDKVFIQHIHADGASWSFEVVKSFKQSNKVSKADTVMIADSNYKMIYESDTGSDRNILKPLISKNAKPGSCKEFSLFQLRDAPLFKYIVMQDYLKVLKAQSKTNKVKPPANEDITTLRLNSYSPHAYTVSEQRQAIENGTLTEWTPMVLNFSIDMDNGILIYEDNVSGTNIEAYLDWNGSFFADKSKYCKP